MASTVTPGRIKITIQESITLGNDDFSNRTQISISNIAEVSKRVLTVPTHIVDVLNLSSSARAGTYASGSLAYARIRNLDNQNFVRLKFSSGSENTCEFKLDPLKSFVFTNGSYSGSATGAAFDSYATFESLSAVADTDSCDLEIYVAST